MRLIKNGDTSHVISVLMIDSADHVSGKTGLTLTVTRSKNGGAFASWSGTTAEVANGWYKLTPAAGDVDTQGDLAIHVTATGADPTDAQALVVAFDPHSATDLGLSTISSRASQTSVDTIDDFLDTEIAAIKAKTDNLPASPAAVGSAMTLDLTQAVPTSNTAQTVGDAFNAARAQGFGKWVHTGTSLVLYAANGSTIVRTFTLDDADAPTTRT